MTKACARPRPPPIRTTRPVPSFVLDCSEKPNSRYGTAVKGPVKGSGTPFCTNMGLHEEAGLDQNKSSAYQAKTKLTRYSVQLEAFDVRAN